MTRRAISFVAILAVAVLVGFDVLATPPNPYAAPSAIALGSGEAASGGFCGALPN